MFRHLIYIYKDPDSTKRIGYVYSPSKSIRHKDIPKRLSQLLKTYKLSIHRITTDASDLKSITEKEKYFENIHFYHDLSEFADVLKEMVSKVKISPVEFAELIASKYPITKSQIQKILHTIHIKCSKIGRILYEDEPDFKDVLDKYKHLSKNDIIESDLPIDKLIRLSKTVYSSDIRKIVEETIAEYTAQ